MHNMQFTLGSTKMQCDVCTWQSGGGSASKYGVPIEGPTTGHATNARPTTAAVPLAQICTQCLHHNSAQLLHQVHTGRTRTSMRTYCSSPAHYIRWQACSRLNAHSFSTSHAHAACLQHTATSGCWLRAPNGMRPASAYIHTNCTSYATSGSRRAPGERLPA